MTCIVGLVDKGKVYMGGDSAGVGDYDLTVRKDTKVFALKKKFLIGYTSSFRMGQILRFHFTPPERKETQDVYKYMVMDFTEKIRAVFKEFGYLTLEKSADWGGTFLVGYEGRLFKIEEDFQVGESFKPYSSVGCGFAYALGSLYSTDKKKPKDRVKLALSAAEEFSAGVRSPFVIMQR